MKYLVLIVPFLIAASSYAAKNICCRVVEKDYRPLPKVQYDLANFMSSWNCAAKKAPRILSMLASLSNEGNKVEIPAEFKDNALFRHSCKQFIAAWNKAATNAPTIESIFRAYIMPTKKAVLVPASAEFLAAWEASAQRIFALIQLLDSVNNIREPNVAGKVNQYTLEFMDAWDTCNALISSLQTSIYQLSGTSPLYGVQTTGTIPQFQLAMDGIDAAFKKAWDDAIVEVESIMDVDIVADLDSLLSQPVHYVPDTTSKFNKVIKAESATFMATWNIALAKAIKIETLLGKAESDGQFTVYVPRRQNVFENVLTAVDEFMISWQEARKRSSVIENAMTLSPDAGEASDKFEILMSAWEVATQRIADVRMEVARYLDPKMTACKKRTAKAEIERFMALFLDSWNTAKDTLSEITSVIYKFADIKPAATSPFPNMDMPVFMPVVEHEMDEFKKAWDIVSVNFPNIDDIFDSIHIPEIPEVEMPNFGTQETVAKFMAAWNNAVAKASSIQSRLVRLGDTGHISVEVPDRVDVAVNIPKASEEFIAAWNEVEVNIAGFVDLLPDYAKKIASSLITHGEGAVQWLTVLQRGLIIFSSSEYSITEKHKAYQEVSHATSSFIASWTMATEKAREIQTAVYKIVGTMPPIIPVGTEPIFTPVFEQVNSGFQKAWDLAWAKFDSTNIMNEISMPKIPVATAPLGIFSSVNIDQAIAEATTDFMAAWNVASETIDQIQKACLRSLETNIFAIPTDSSKRTHLLNAVKTFMAAYNSAIRRSSFIEKVILDLPAQEEGAQELKRNLAEYLYAWHAAAKRILILREYLTANPYMCKRCLNEKVLPEFFSACSEASSRIQKFETALYALSGVSALDTCAACLAPAPVSSQTPDAKVAKLKYIDNFHKSMSLIPQIKDSTSLLAIPSAFAKYVSTYSFTTRSQVIKNQLPNRLFAPIRSLPIFVSECSVC
ncbi:uncharacterized protein LOC122247112 [Penaeus japonicus]|uniref:uncharacterized protein LOC122247112 n=1 Tax=Penaeus japonicus TaxID=27405 RepID=UPI001C716239|nr:uncharacterized protein LOC122247112 [Penaeus japonicus]